MTIMTNRRQILLGALAAATGVATWGTVEWYNKSRQSPLFKLALPDLEGQQQALRQWQGRPLLVNFWATWCDPCREEMPALMQARKDFSAKSVEVVGIGIDNALKMQQFREKLGIPYPLLVGGIESLELMRQLGNQGGVLPFSLFFKASGELAGTHAGALTTPEIHDRLSKLLA